MKDLGTKVYTDVFHQYLSYQSMILKPLQFCYTDTDTTYGFNSAKNEDKKKEVENAEERKEEDDAEESWQCSKESKKEELKYIQSIRVGLMEFVYLYGLGLLIIYCSKSLLVFKD